MLNCLILGFIFGQFSAGLLITGKCLFCEHEYEGGFESLKFNGDGEYKWTNGKFVGKFNNGSAEGFGSIKCSDGFQWEGIFEDNEPKERVVHPTILKNIRKGICDPSIANPQYFFLCFICKRFYCEVCTQHCHDLEHGSTPTCFRFGRVCGCMKQDTVPHISDIPSTKKQKLM